MCLNTSCFNVLLARDEWTKASVILTNLANFLVEEVVMGNIPDVMILVLVGAFLLAVSLFG